MLLKRLNITSQLKKLITLVALILVMQVKKTDCNTEFSEIDIKITTDHTRYTTEEFNELASKNLATRLAQANLASKNGITNFLKETDFDNKLISFNERTILDKSKHVLELNDPSNKLKHYQQKR